MDRPQKNRTIITISLLTIILGLVIMGGWLFHIPSLASILAGHVAMRFNAALCFSLFGGAVLSSQYHIKKYNNPAFISLTLLGTIIAIATIYQDIFHVSTGIDQLFVNDNSLPSSGIPFPGRMAFNASASFCLLGIGLLMLFNNKPLFTTIAQYVFHAVTVISGIALIGDMYGVELFSTLFYVTSMAITTALLFFILSIAASLLNPAAGIARLFTGHQVGNQMAKRLFTLMILAVIIFGSLNDRTRHLQLFSSLDISITVLIVLFLFVSLLLIWNTANWLNRIDTKRSEAEAEVKRMNIELEKRVEGQTGELREAELKFRTIAERSMVGVYIVQDNMFTYVNPRFANVFGYEPADLLFDTNAGEKIFDPNYLGTVREHIRKRIEGEVDSVHYEAMGLKKDGTNNWVEIYGNRVLIGGKPAIIGSMIDISERKKAEEELRSSEQKYKLIFESSPMPMWMIAKDDLSIIAVNDAAARHYGYMKDELLNMSVTAMRPGEDTAEQLEAYKHDTQEVRIVRHLKKDGSEMIVEITAHDIIFEGRPVRLSLTNDITERKHAEENLKSAYKRIQDHINSIKDMAWKQSHLIRSPLANLKGLAAMLNTDMADPEVIEHIQNELHRMDAIIIEMAEDVSGEHND